MKVFQELSNDICLSIHQYCRTKIPFIMNERQTNKKNQELFLCLYMDWVLFVSKEQKSLWKKVKKYKNNLSFIHLTLSQFEKEFECILTKSSPPVHLQNYYQYANDLCVEAFGKELQPKRYLKSELLSIIKECESVIKENLLKKQKPSHNIIPIRV
jgi:hypothetical protein